MQNNVYDIPNKVQRHGLNWLIGLYDCVTTIIFFCTVNILSSSVPPPQQVDGPLFTPSPVSVSPANTASSISVQKRAETLGNFDLRGSKPSFSSNNINRTVSVKPSLGKPLVLSETDSGPNKPRRQSQLLSVLGRTKTMGSTEDLTSISSSSSLTSITTISSAMSQVILHDMH